MANNIPINVRIKFKKTGNLQYVSHLDLVRTMHKIVVRSKLPLWYTEGFNPKPKMVFAAPLSVGVESFTEFMDLRVTERIDPQNVIETLNSNMTDDLKVLEAYYPDSKLTDLKWFLYSICIHTDGASVDLADKCQNALDAEVIQILKKTKSGEANVDIKPLVKNSEAFFNGNDIIISCVLSADSSSFLNPEYVIGYLKKECGILLSGCLVSEWYTIKREQAYTSEMVPFR